MPRQGMRRARRVVALAGALLATGAIAACGGGDERAQAPPPEVGLPGPEAAAAIPAATTAVLAVDLRAPAQTRRRAVELALRLQPALDAAGDDDGDDAGDPLIAGLIARRAEAGQAWATGQLAVALAPGGRPSSGTAYVLASRDRAAAERTVRSILPRARRQAAGPDAVRLDTARSHALVVPGGVVFGDARAVDAVAAARRSGAQALASTPAYRRAMTGLRGVDAVVLRPPGAAAGGAAAGLPPARVDVRLLDGGLRAGLHALRPDGSTRALPTLRGALREEPGLGVLAAASTESPGVLVRALAGAAASRGSGGQGLQGVQRVADLLRGAEVRTVGTSGGLRTTIGLVAPDGASARQLAALGTGLGRQAGGRAGAVRVRAAGARVLVTLRTPYAGARAPGATSGGVLETAARRTGAPPQALLLPASSVDALRGLAGAGPGSRALARAFASIGVASPGGALQVGLAYRGPVPAPEGDAPLENLIPAAAPAPTPAPRSG